MRILFYCWKAYNQSDIIAALRRRGHVVDMFEMELGNFEEDDNFTEKFTKKLFAGENTECVYDAVFSVNYFPIISDICEQLSETGLKYICWTCDSPLSTMYHESIFNKCNYIFIFDRFCYMDFKERGANVYYLPLAAAVERADEVIGSWQENSQMPGQDYLYDVSFVGSMYRKNSYDEIKDMLPDYVRGYFDALMKLQMEIYGENYIDGMLTADIIEELNRHFKIEKSERSFSDISLIFSTTVLGFKIAEIERRRALIELSKHFEVNVYSNSNVSDLVRVRYCGSVDYWSEMPKVFHQSKINLNFTIPNIKSGIPLRIWDVLGAGGFLLTNYQAEIPLYFKEGEDLVCFDGVEDLVQKAGYYLAHEDERAQIAKNGYEKVKKYHSYVQRIQTILDTVCKDECNL